MNPAANGMHRRWDDGCLRYFRVLGSYRSLRPPFHPVGSRLLQ